MSEFIFIAGAPRSGTTFLTEQLGASSQVVLSNEGASYYFMDEEHPLLNKYSNCHKDGIEGFFNVFPKKNGKYYLDGTDHLMYQLSMIDILAQLPEKKMIFIFREPAERIYSSFSYTKNNLGNFKKDISFKTYVDALLRNDKRLIQSWMHSKEKSGFILAHELEYSYYSNYISKWIERIGKENMIFLSFNDMLKDKSVFINSLAKTLNLNPVEMDAANKNESFGIKNKLIHKQISKMSSWFPKSEFKNKIKNIYFGIQKNKIIKTEEDQEQINKLKRLFEDSNKELLTLTGLDLSTWK